MGNLFSCVETGSVEVIERCGKFNRFAYPGLNCVWWCLGEAVAGRLSMRVQQLDVEVETKTFDNVFVTIIVSLQYQVCQPDQPGNAAHSRWPQTPLETPDGALESRRGLLSSGVDIEGPGPSNRHGMGASPQPVSHAQGVESVYKAFYTLTNVHDQIRAYVYDAVRSAVPKMSLDDVFASKDEIARDVMNELAAATEAFGFTMIQTLITDVVPAQRVKDAMNEINTASRLRLAALHKAEADKVMVVKKAEADAEAKFLAGQGIALERQAIMHGLQESVEGFSTSVSGISSSEVLSMMMISTYFDALRDMAVHGKASTVFVPHQPGALEDISSQIRHGIFKPVGPLEGR